MKRWIVPGTRPGIWSLALMGGMAVFFIVFQALVSSGQRGGETFFDNLYLSVPVALFFLCGIASFITGSLGIVFKGERSVFVFLTTIIGLFVLVFIIGEFLMPH